MTGFGGVETPNGESSDGSGFPKDSPRDTRDLPSLLSSCYPITLKVYERERESFSSDLMAQLIKDILLIFFFTFHAVRGRELPSED